MHISKKELTILIRRLQYYQETTLALNKKLYDIRRKKDQMHIDEECALKIVDLEDAISGLLEGNIDRPLLLDEYVLCKRKYDELLAQSADNTKRIEELSATIKEMQ